MNRIKTRPKALILIDTYHIGGAGKVLLQFIENADRSRFDYSLANFRYPDPPSTEFIDTARNKGFNLVLFSQRFNLDPAPLWQAYRVIRRGDFNLIETHGYKGHLVAWVLSRLTGIKWVGMTHGWTNENAKVRLYNRLEKWLLKRADHVISVSPQLAATMRKVRSGRGGVSLVLNAVDEDSIRGRGEAYAIRQRCSNNNPDCLVIGSFGRLSPEKGHETLLRASADLLRDKNASLILVGDGQERKKLEELAASLGVAGQVFFEGQHQNMADYYSAIDLFVLPSLSEGLPFVVLEAMAMAKPVLATRVGAMEEVIEEGKNGWLVTPGDIDTLAGKLTDLASNRDLLNHIGQRGRQMLYPRFSPGRQCDEVMTIYEDVVNA